MTQIPRSPFSKVGPHDRVESTFRSPLARISPRESPRRCFYLRHRSAYRRRSHFVLILAFYRHVSYRKKLRKARCLQIRVRKGRQYISRTRIFTEEIIPPRVPRFYLGSGIRSLRRKFFPFDKDSSRLDRNHVSSIHIQEYTPV